MGGAHCDKMAALCSELTAAGLSIDDGGFYEHILASLPRSFDMFAAHYK